MGDHPVKVCDIHIGENKNKFLFILRTSKTHWKDVKPQKVKIASKKIQAICRKYKKDDFEWCLFGLLQSYRTLRLHCLSRDKPFFIFRDNSPVTPAQMRTVLKSVLDSCGFDTRLYSTHRLCTGRALDLLAFGLSVETIKKMGRWKSNVLFTYFK